MYYDSHDPKKRETTPRRKSPTFAAKPALNRQNLQTLTPQKLVSLFAELTNGNKVKDYMIKYKENAINETTIKYFIEFGLL